VARETGAESDGQLVVIGKARRSDAIDNSPATEKLHRADLNDADLGMIDYPLALLDQRTVRAAPTEIKREREPDRPAADDQDRRFNLLCHCAAPAPNWRRSLSVQPPMRNSPSCGGSNGTVHGSDFRSAQARHKFEESTGLPESRASSGIARSVAMPVPVRTMASAFSHLSAAAACNRVHSRLDELRRCLQTQTARFASFSKFSSLRVRCRSPDPSAYRP
jgi:hypothetical protein